MHLQQMYWEKYLKQVLVTLTFQDSIRCINTGYGVCF